MANPPSSRVGTRHRPCLCGGLCAGRASVAIADINLERARQTASEIGENAYAVELDVTRQESIDAAVGPSRHATGGIDNLINKRGAVRHGADRRDFPQEL